MAMTPVYDGLVPETAALEESIHGALDACDSYRTMVAAALAAEQAKDEANDMLAARMTQFIKRIDSITEQIEDGVLDDLNFLNHRLFAVKLAEEGTFI